MAQPSTRCPFPGSLSCATRTLSHADEGVSESGTRKVTPANRGLSMGTGGPVISIATLRQPDSVVFACARQHRTRMTFPESPRVVYEQDTLNQVVCALNFPPILSIGTETPAELQEALRESYPLYESRPTGPQLQLEGDGPPQGMIEMLGQLGLGQRPMPQQHRFSTEDQTRTVVVGPRLLAVEDATYDEWAAFSQHVAVARAAVERIYRPAFYTRVGLRYQDVIRRKMLKDDAEWTDVIKPTLLGLLGAPELDTIQELSGTALISLDHPESFVRVNHGLGTDEATKDNVYVIEADFYTEGRSHGNDIDSLLTYFNTEAGNLFRWAITQELHDALGRRTNN